MNMTPFQARQVDEVDVFIWCAKCHKKILPDVKTCDKCGLCLAEDMFETLANYCVYAPSIVDTQCKISKDSGDLHYVIQMMYEAPPFLPPDKNGNKQKFYGAKRIPMLEFIKNYPAEVESVAQIRSEGKQAVMILTDGIIMLVAL